MKIIVVVQARTGSSRLPGKVSMLLAGKSVLERQLERILAAKTAFDLLVATTTESGDDEVRKICRKMGIACFSGHPTDLLDRHYQAVLPEKPDAVVKIPADCPLIDPAIIDKVLQTFIHSKESVDFVSNLHPATYPDGNDVEVMTFNALQVAWQKADRPMEREHTTPYIWERPGQFKIQNVEWETGLNYSMSHRFTIDYQEDYDFISRVYDELFDETHPIFTLDSILKLLEEKPDIYKINSKYAGVNWYRHHMDELKTVKPTETKIIEE